MHDTNAIQVVLDKFNPRPYQFPIWDMLENKGYKRILAILPRRAGKDFCVWSLLIRQALKTVGIYWYIWPTYSQGRKGLFDGMTHEGVRFLDFIPRELVDSIHKQEMKIRLVNGSLIQVVGSNNYDRLMGANPRGCVFTEYALQDPRAYQYIRPILAANNGFIIVLSTPRGKNHLYTLWEIAQSHPDIWFSYKLTIDDTKHINPQEIEELLRTGEMSEDKIQQEFYCSFDLGVEGAYYAKYLDTLYLNDQIGNVPWNPAYPVTTAWDLGYSDSTAIVFVQCIGTNIHVIDCYEKSKEGLEHYIHVLKQKPYTYNAHIAPHDIKVHEFTSGISRFEKARQLGVTFTVADNIPLMDGIEAVRSTLPRMYIDQTHASAVIKALENYHQEYDSRLKIYKNKPLHDWSSHMSDAIRYLCVSLHKTQPGLTAEELDQRYRRAMYGEDTTMPPFFRGNTYY